MGAGPGVLTSTTPTAEDPWQGVSKEDQWRALCEDEVPSFTVGEFLQQRGLEQEQQAVMIEYLKENEGDGISNEPRVVGADLSKLCSYSDWKKITIALPFLRLLNLSGLKLGAIELGAEFSHLLVLDLSYTDLRDIDSTKCWSFHDTLWKLCVDGCNLAKIPSFVGQFTQLRVLSAVENELESIDDVPIQLALLEELDLRENLLGDSNQDELALTRFPKLKILNNRLLNKNGAEIQLQKLQGLHEAMISGDTVADLNEDRGSCSCLEGSPCEVEYTCKDWKNRFAIAEQSKRQ